MLSKRHLNLRVDHADRKRIVDGSGNAILLCVSGWDQDAEEVVKVWQNSPNASRLLVTLRSGFEDVKKSLEKLDVKSAQNSLAQIETILNDV